MNCQNQFPRKNKKSISIRCLLKIVPSMLSLHKTNSASLVSISILSVFYVPSVFCQSFQVVNRVNIELWYCSGEKYSTLGELKGCYHTLLTNTIVTLPIGAL